MDKITIPVFVSWSGGKDCAQSCYRAMNMGMQVRYLLNMATPDGKRGWTHGQSAEIIKLQAQAIGIPIVQPPTSLDDYDRNFNKAVRDLGQKGIKGGIFGTIDVPEHREWSKNICEGTGVTPYLPLWNEDQTEILKKFIAAGFRAVIVATDASRMGEEWLGQEIDGDFLERIRKTPNITPCGEDGEYHTFVYDGPIFKKRIEILNTRKTLHEGHWFLEILDARLIDK